MSTRNGNRLAGPRGPVLVFREGRDAADGMRRLRASLELRQADLAMHLGRNVTWVQARESGSVRLTRAEADEVAAALGTDFTGLLAAGARNLNNENGTGQ